MESVNYLKKGFTLVELLIVMVIIGILATLTIINYKGSQQKAYDASVQQDLRNMGDQFDIFRTNSGASDQYPQTTSDLSTLELKASKSNYNTSLSVNVVMCVSSNGKSYAIVSQSNAGNNFIDTQSGFSSTSQTPSTSTCSSLGLNLIAYGWSSGSWSNWLKN